MTDPIEEILIKRFAGPLMRQLTDEATDEFLEVLLNGLRLSLRKELDHDFSPFKGYRRNIRDFRGRYLFRTADGGVAVSAVFGDGELAVGDDAIDDWNVRVTFRDGAALRAFLFSKNQDILDSLLRNDVEVDGNLNYVFKFGFMVRDLARRLGVA